MSVVVKEGFMHKQGGSWKTWKKRWFSLVDKELVYRKEQNSQPLGRIKLSDPELITLATVSECKRQPTFKVTDPSRRSFFMQTSSMEEANSWVDACRKVASGIGERFSVSWADFTVVEVLFAKDSGSIELVTLTSNNRQFIRKTYQRKLIKDYDIVVQSKKEMVQLINPFVTTLNYILHPDSGGENAEKFGLVYEYATHGCLFGILWVERKFSESRTQLYAAEIFLGLNFLHQRRITYRDLAPDCILLMDDGHVKLPDPGLLPMNTRRKEYLAPEAWSGMISTEAGDWYSFGAIIYEMICGLPPFWNDDEETLKISIQNEPLRFPHHVSRTAKEFLTRLMAKEPSGRLGSGSGGSEEIKNHPFFIGINWADVSQRAVAPEWIPGPNFIACKKLDDYGHQGEEDSTSPGN
jgi:serine/threonine protein kinase